MQRRYVAVRGASLAGGAFQSWSGDILESRSFCWVTLGRERAAALGGEGKRKKKLQRTEQRGGRRRVRFAVGSFGWKIFLVEVLLGRISEQGNGYFF